jgi:muconolactone delta-isomerase
MRFLIVTKSKFPFPPEMAGSLFDAIQGWVDANTNSGRMEQAWAFAGLQGGGGILKVDSFEELDSIMTSMPFGPFSNVEVYGLSDIKQALNAGKQAVAMMMKGA